MGYVVKPFYVKAEKKESSIIQFEKLIKANYSNYYDKYYGHTGLQKTVIPIH